MSDYGLVANGCLAHHFWHVRYLGIAILHSAKLFWQISNMPSILNNCAEFELIANSSWFWILMKIVFSVKLFFGDFECGQMAYYHFFYQTCGTRRYIDFCGVIMTSFLIQQVDSETPLQMRGLNFEHLLDGDWWCLQQLRPCTTMVFTLACLQTTHSCRLSERHRLNRPIPIEVKYINRLLMGYCNMLSLIAKFPT